MAYSNNVLYYIDLNLKRSSEDKLIEVCKLLFPENEIVEAKQYLYDNCQPVLVRLNKTLAVEVKKDRQNSVNRPKVDVIIKDIIDILECFIGNEQKLEIKAKNVESIPKFNPESVNLISVVTRLEEISKKISKENVKLNCECDCENVKKENVLLKNKIVDIEQKYQNIEKILAELQIADVLPRSSPVPRSDMVEPPETIASTPEIPEGNVDKGKIIDAKTNPDNVKDVSGNDSNIILVNNESLPTEQSDPTHKERSIEGNDNPPVDNLTALDHASDTSRVPVSDTDANPATGVSLATDMPIENASSQQNNVDEKAKRNTNANAWRTVSSKSKGKIKHERNLASTEQTIAATMEATRNGKTDEEIKQIGMDAATATCKSYANILTKKINGNKGNTISQNKTNKAKVPHIRQYKKGKCVSSDNSIAAERPKYLDGKCLVVSRIKRDTTKSDFISYINRIAGKNVNFLSSPRNLAKDYSTWRTVAIELSNEDYEILSNPDIWDSNLRIKDFVGRRYWHNKASIMSVNERKSTVYQSWQK